MPRTFNGKDNFLRFIRELVDNHMVRSNINIIGKYDEIKILLNYLVKNGCEFVCGDLDDSHNGFFHLQIDKEEGDLVSLYKINNSYYLSDTDVNIIHISAIPMHIAHECLTYEIIYNDKLRLNNNYHSY